MLANSVQAGGEIHVRESLEALELAQLHPRAAKSSQSRGRKTLEEPCPLRTIFQRDRDRILHSKAFRRLKHKTQVFISPVGDHYRTRLTHSLEVAQVARTIARALRLNEDLTEAIALGHDLGHPPFGHSGEEVLNELAPNGYQHEKQSVRIAELLEPLNLSYEVLDGMLAQINQQAPETLEAQIVKIADRMTYLHHDVEDAIRAGLMKEADIPKEIAGVLGQDREARLRQMVGDIVRNTAPVLDKPDSGIQMSGEVREAMMALRKWMFEHVYLTPVQKIQKRKVGRLITGLYEYFCAYPEVISENIPEDPTQGPATIEQRAIDYIAGMTDRYATKVYIEALLPNPYHSQNEEVLR